MSRIRERITSASIQSTAGFDSIENSILITTNRIEIINNEILLPKKGYGNIVWNMAMIFDNEVDNIIVAEATCSMGIEGITAVFDSNDNLNGKYAVISYLGKINEE